MDTWYPRDRSCPRVQPDLPSDWPTESELTSYLESVQSQVKGRIVLAGRHTPAPVNLTPPPKRREDGQLRTQFEPGRESPAPRRPDAASNEPERLPAGQVSRRIDQFLVESGALLRVNDGRREHGQIIAFSNTTYDVTKVLPTVVMRNEDYGRIARILADGTPVELEFDIVNRLFPEGRTAYNAIAEIEGSDLKHQVVMIGGHLDSWQSGTGATDNAVGCATMMEAVRILKALGVQPRRTIRVALWSGEEQGLLGSRAYVAEHFGSFEQPKSSFPNLVAYLNMDTGTGRLRGATVFGPQEAATALRSILAPFESLGVAGAISTRNRNTGGTDSTVFNRAGLPGVNFTQDPIEYDSHTQHTNLDTYERVLESDVKDAAVVLASTVYELAMRDDMLPRFKPQDMPAVPPAR